MNAAYLLQGDAAHLPLADQSVDLTFTSPPYLAARTYGIGAQRDCEAWVTWMLDVVVECCRVTRGLVLVNCAGTTKDWRYQPGPELLLSDWWRRGGECWRPAYWHRVGIPGSGGKQWLRADVEYVLAFKGAAGKVPWADNTACGHPPKWGPGGEMSNRNSVGKRLNQWGPVGTAKGFGNRFRHGEQTPSEGTPRPSHVLVPGGGAVSNAHQDGRDRNARTGGRALGPFGNQQSSVGRRANGERKPPCFNGHGSMMAVTGGTGPTGEQLPNVHKPHPVLANPGNLVRVAVGGGKLGSKIAHENEAPFPEALAEFFIKSFCPPGGTCLDPFSGSGTTVSVARRLGRVGIGVDLRMSQCELGRRRLAEPERPEKRPRVTRPSPPALTLFSIGGAA